ncbi:MAG: hypothetical protein AAF942_00065 [Pseudomonadota bacterium]
MKDMEVADVRFTVDGQEHKLEPPTARIAFAISRELGGLGTMLDRLQAGDMDAYYAVLRAAWAGAPDTEEELQEFVFRHCADFHLQLVKYAWSLQNGGKTWRPPEDQIDDESAEGNAKPATAKKKG